MSLLRKHKLKLEDGDSEILQMVFESASEQVEDYSTMAPYVRNVWLRAFFRISLDELMEQIEVERSLDCDLDQVCFQIAFGALIAYLTDNERSKNVFIS